MALKTRLLGKPIGERQWLRVYWGKCPGPMGYHDAEVLLGDVRKDVELPRPQVLVVVGPEGRHPCPSGGDHEHLGFPAEKWPQKCDACPEKVPTFVSCEQYWKSPDEPTYQLFTRLLYDTPEGVLSPGDMFWLEPAHKGPCYWGWDNCDNRHLIAVMPDGHHWDVMGRASNCTLKDDRQHRCWVLEQPPPNATVGKNGRSCNAGGGSIQMSTWHGFLRNGELVEA